MKELSATEAARRFSEVLDSVESGRETFTVLRRGRAVARIGPAVAGSGRALKEALGKHPPDVRWAADLRALRASIGAPQERWRD